MAVVEIDVGAVCDTCGTELSIESVNNVGLVIAPCEKCMDEAYTQGKTDEQESPGD